MTVHLNRRPSVPEQIAQIDALIAADDMTIDRLERRRLSLTKARAILVQAAAQHAANRRWAQAVADLAPGRHPATAVAE